LKRPYLLKKRGKVWYYRLADELTFHSTGLTFESRAHNHVLAIFEKKKRKQELYGKITLKQ
jgi:hypothetical protein